MNITVVNGTEIKGCTYNIKELFLEDLREGNEVTEFYLPKDLPHFCLGCKTCFFKSENECPHAQYVMPIWEAILNADLLVFTSPIYALRTTGQMKSLLDHFCVHWMVHRPDERMFDKTAVILTNAVGAFTGGAQKDIGTSLSWLGISKIRKSGIGLIEGVIWNELSEKKREAIAINTKKLAAKCKNIKPVGRGIKNRLLFAIMKAMHGAAAKKENPLSADNVYWKQKGWIRVD